MRTKQKFAKACEQLGSSCGVWGACLGSKLDRTSAAIFKQALPPEPSTGLGEGCQGVDI